MCKLFLSIDWLSSGEEDILAGESASFLDYLDSFLHLQAIPHFPMVFEPMVVVAFDSFLRDHDPRHLLLYCESLIKPRYQKQIQIYQTRL